MIVTRNISLDKPCIEKMKPFVEKHNGNFSAAIREIIRKTGKSGLPAHSSAIDSSLFNWMLDELNGVLIPDKVLDKLIDPHLINSMGRLEEYLKYRFSELEYDVDIDLKYDSPSYPSNLLIEIKGENRKIKLIALMLSQFFVKNSSRHLPLEIKSVTSFDTSIKIELYKSNKKDTRDTLISFFGQRDEIMEVIKSRPDFWKAIVRRHILSNYNMVTVHKNYLEDLLARKVPLGEITIENLFKKPINEIPLKEMLSLIKEVYETSRVVDRVEIDKDTIILFHSYRSVEAVETLKKILVMLLGANGHLYNASSTSNMIVLKHRPDVGIKINEIVDNLRMSKNRVDQELLVFMTFLKGLKDIPDIPLSLTALGRRIGKSLMQEYEKENRVRNWDLMNFQKAFEAINSKLHMESEWKLNGNNLLYTVRNCYIATEDNQFDTYICHTARETFKGALSYAFGNKAELKINKLRSHGDNFCEFVIRLP